MLQRLKDRLWRRLLAPPLLARGWRPPEGIPLSGLPRKGRFGFDEEEPIRAAAARVAGHSMASFERLASLWHQVRYLDRCEIDGDLVECGVWKGGACGMMALAHLASGEPRRRLHLFDSFQGLPEPQAEEDGTGAVAYAGDRGAGELEPIDRCVGSLEENRRLLEDTLGYPRSLLSYHVGWFEDTVPEEAPAIDRIALLRLDGDWYESTRVCLEHLYPRVVPGGVVVIDDYGHWQGCRRAVDELLASRREPILLSHIDYTGRYWVRVGRA